MGSSKAQQGRIGAKIGQKALKLDSELAFIGDAGNEAGRPSDRYGVEWSNRWRVSLSDQF